MPYSKSVAVRCKLEDVKLISESIQWPTGGQCDDWYFMSLTRRSTEGILEVVSEQTKHTGISFFLCFEVIRIGQFVPEYATIAINLSLLQHYNLGTCRGPDKIGSRASPRASSSTWLAQDVHTPGQRWQECVCLHLQGCREVTRLVGEVEDLTKMTGSMNMMVTGQRLEEKGGETGDSVAALEEAEKEKCEGGMPPDNISTGEIRTEKETAGTIWTEERDSVLEIEVELGTKRRKSVGRRLTGRRYAQERRTLQRKNTRRTRRAQRENISSKGVL